MLYTFRCTLSDVLFNVFGYLAPALNSVKAVCSNDLDGIKEYLTYWAVLSVFGCFGMLASHLRLIQNYPPEARVLCVLWLTLPRFQGAYRIYVLFLKWSYKKYEADIDEQVTSLSGKLSDQMWSKFKMMLLVLFLSNNDSIARYAENSDQGLISFASALVLNGWNACAAQVEPQTKPPKPSADNKPSMDRLKAQMLSEFVVLLNEGVYIKGFTRKFDQNFHITPSASVCQFLLVDNVLYLRDLDDDASSVLATMKLGDIRSVEHVSDSDAPPNSVRICSGADSTHEHTVYLQAEDKDEAYMIVSGLQLLMLKP
jgi:hypothetical protein